MKTILVPTDFSAVAKNAAIYAMKLAHDIRAEKIILYNAYQGTPIITEPAVPAMPMMDLDVMKDISADSMKNFKKTIEVHCPEQVKLDTITEFGILANELEDVCKKTNADIIVMGISNSSKIEEMLIGSTAISVFRQSKIPVIVVPADGTFSSIQNIMLASDLKKVVESTPVQPIIKILEATHAKLHILNIYESEKEISAEKTFQQELLQSLFKDYNPQFHFINNENFIEGINEFVDANKIDMVITIPKKHGFFDGLFREGHAKKLAFHSHVPLMYVHEGEL